MKKNYFLSLISILFVAQFCFGQSQLPFDSITQQITYKEIVKCDTLSAHAGYLKALKWAQQEANKPTKANGPKFIIQRMDEDSNKIVAIGKFDIQYQDISQQTPLTVYYTMILESKNGRTRIQVTDLKHDDLPALRVKATPSKTFEETYAALSGKSKASKNAWMGFFTDCDQVFKSALEAYKLFILKPPPPKPPSDDW
jgi:hypothetical protein